ncbi:MAG: hypothetical protein V5A21_12520 [Halapricum sp.]
MSDDPFDDLDPERDGNPFEELGDGIEAGEETSPPDGAESDQQPDEQPFDGEPLGEESARQRRTDLEGDPFEGLDVRPGEDPFEGGDWTIEDADESVWEELSTEPEVESQQEEGRRVSEVNKHSFCEGCVYFTEPPETACTHEGAEIRRFLDVETVEVVDCPIVEERERLKDAGTQG